MNIESSQTVANKVYSSYEEALSLCNGVGYSMRQLTDVVIEKNLILRQSIKPDVFLNCDVTRTLISLGFAFNSRSIRVLDFGGGGGYHYTIARHILGEDLNIKWNIVETDSMCTSGLSLEDQSMKYFTSINLASTDLGYVDLLLTSSALQYCPEPLESLNELMNVKAKYLYVTRTPFFSGEKKIISIQSSMLSQNGPGPLPAGYEDQEVFYPITFIPLNLFETVIKEKYKILFKVIEEPANLFIEGKAVNSYFGYFCELL